jgi:tRNA threonylcarbamoyl adenosine modification protein YeaZ
MAAQNLMLAIQTAVEPAQIALLSADRILGTAIISERFAVCRELAPEISALLRTNSAQCSDVQLVAGCTGPGSFTGIRIGVASAKAFAHALAIPLVGVDALQVLAETVAAETSAIIAVIPAGRNRYFCARYLQNELTGEPALLDELDLAAWLERENSLKIDDSSAQPLLVYPVPDPRLSSLAEKSRFVFHQVPCQAEVVGKIGWRKLADKATVEALALQPFYLRTSTPEERVAGRG